MVKKLAQGHKASRCRKPALGSGQSESGSSPTLRVHKKVRRGARQKPGAGPQSKMLGTKDWIHLLPCRPSPPPDSPHPTHHRAVTLVPCFSLPDLPRLGSPVLHLC